VVGSAAGVEVPHRSAMGHCQRRRGSGSMISGAPLERHGSQGAEGSWRRVPQPRFTWDATVWIGANNFHVAIGASSTWRRAGVMVTRPLAGVGQEPRFPNRRGDNGGALKN
jgi:hypothetical protein